MLCNGLVIMCNYLHVAMIRKSSPRPGYALLCRPPNLILSAVVVSVYTTAAHLTGTILNCGRIYYWTITCPSFVRLSHHRRRECWWWWWHDLSRHCQQSPWPSMHNSAYVKINLILLISCQAEIRVHELFRCERA